jgi:hypothetical protein
MNNVADPSVVCPLIRKPGRPPLYTEEQRAEIARLSEQYGLTGAMRALRADTGSPEASYRDGTIFPAPVNISLPTISKIAKANGIGFRRGPRQIVTVQVAQTTEATEATQVVETAEVAQVIKVADDNAIEDLAQL